MLIFCTGSMIDFIKYRLEMTTVATNALPMIRQTSTMSTICLRILTVDEM